MSRSAWINELVEAGYEPGVLDGLNNNELAELKQEEYIENTWSPAAREAAAKARGNRGKRKKVFTVTGYGGLDKKKNQYTSFKRVNIKASDSKEAVAKAKLALPDTHHGSMETKEGAMLARGHRGRVHK